MWYNANIIKQFEKSLINNPKPAQQQINEYYFPAFPIHTNTSFSAVHGSKHNSHNFKSTKEYGYQNIMVTYVIRMVTTMDQRGSHIWS
jgi:hypothetical protein